MASTRPVDRSKRSNRRCCNCANWHRRAVLPQALRSATRFFRCPVGQKDIEYWSCCPRFKWDPSKDYKEETP